MEYIWATGFIFVLLLMLGLNIVSLPGNWIMLGLAWVWDLVHPSVHLGWDFYGPLIVLAAVGEVVEFVSQFYGAKKYGGSSKGNIGAILGAITGAIFCAPFLLGFGALIGGVGGAYLGCYFFERMHGRPSDEAWLAAKGAMWGKVLGFAVKLGLGAAMLVIITRMAWPSGGAASQQILTDFGGHLFALLGNPGFGG